MKFTNFPRVTYISLKESSDRRNDLVLQLESRGIFNHKMIECFDGRSTNYLNNNIVTGPYLNGTESEVIATSMSHVKAIYDWYTTSEDDIGFFCEDDIKFDMVDNWSFTWEEFIGNLPVDWKIIQLALIRTETLTSEDMKLHIKKWDDWSCCAYIINRTYTKQLLDDYYNNGIFTFDIKNTDHIPLPENIIYTSNYLQTYTIPLFTENRIHKSTLIRKDSYDHHAQIQDDACRYIINWWSSIGNKLTIRQLMDLGLNDIKQENVPMITKIPVIGAAVVSNPYWISRLLLSIDYPVENFVIINNNGRGEIDEELDRLTKITHKFVDNIKVVHMPANIGCGGAWNLIIKCYMNSPYWIIVNDDVAFNPGLLEEMSTLINGNPDIGMIHPNVGDFGIGAWDLFLIKDHIVQNFGLFDENCYPAYCEDADYIMRMIHRPIIKIIGTLKTYQHGNDDSKNYYKSGSQTEKSIKGLKDLLNNANNLNIEYLTKKWGPGWRVLNPSKNPFENQAITTTTYDLNFVRSKYMGF